MKLTIFKGFTLAELIISIGIISFLVSVAIPNFKKYVAKTRSTEAKIQLSALYVAEKIFRISYEVFAGCLDIVGYDPSKDFNSRYYSIGFHTAQDTANLLAVNNGAPNVCINAKSICDQVTLKNCYGYTGGKKLSNAPNIVGIPQIQAARVGFHAVVSNTGDQFTALAGAYVSGAKIEEVFAKFKMHYPAVDIWSIDNNKTIIHRQKGY